LDDFVARDHELEAAHERSGEALAEHRWRWTLDESNPERVSLREYARRVGRDQRTIRAQAHGFAAWHARGEAVDGLTLHEHIARERMSAEKVEATEAVAAARGSSFTAAAHPQQRAEVRQVLQQAQDRAERKGTTVSDELPAVAEWREQARRAEANRKDELRRAKGAMLVRLEGHLGAAIRDLREALAVARDIDFDDEQVELISDTLGSLRTIVGLIDVRLTGQTGIDWDRAFADVMEGGESA
jgi:hypothetical protein